MKTKSNHSHTHRMRTILKLKLVFYWSIRKAISLRLLLMWTIWRQESRVGHCLRTFFCRWPLCYLFILFILCIILNLSSFLCCFHMTVCWAIQVISWCLRIEFLHVIWFHKPLTWFLCNLGLVFITSSITGDWMDVVLLVYIEMYFYDVMPYWVQLTDLVTKCLRSVTMFSKTSILQNLLKFVLTED